MIYEGMIEEGLTVVKSIRDRHDGIKRNPWSEFECGSHYARSMANWSVYEAPAGYSVGLTGQSDAIPDRGFRFDPVPNEDDFVGFWTTDEAWGTYIRSVDSTRSVDETAEVLCERT